MHELTVTRFIDAPPAKVWEVMTDRLEEWWCPLPWKTELIAQERRPGGRSAMIMRGPDGEEQRLEGVHLAWDAGRRFVTTDAVRVVDGNAFQPNGPFMIGSWTIEPEGSGTRYTATASHWTEDAMAQHRDMGFE